MSKASEAASEEPAVEFDVLEGFPGSYKAGRSKQWSLDIPWEVTTWATSATTLIPKLWDVCGTTPIGGTPRSSLVVGAGSWGLEHPIVVGGVGAVNDTNEHKRRVCFRIDRPSEAGRKSRRRKHSRDLAGLLGDVKIGGSILRVKVLNGIRSLMQYEVCFARPETVAMLDLGRNKQRPPYSPPLSTALLVFPRFSLPTRAQRQHSSRKGHLGSLSGRNSLANQAQTVIPPVVLRVSTPTRPPHATLSEYGMADGVLDVTSPFNVSSVLVVIGAVLCFILGRSLKKLAVATRAQLLQATDEELEVAMGETGRRPEEETTRMEQCRLLAETPAALKTCCDHTQWPCTLLFWATEWNAVRQLQQRLEACYYKVQGHLEMMGRTPVYAAPDQDANEQVEMVVLTVGSDDAGATDDERNAEEGIRMETVEIPYTIKSSIHSAAEFSYFDSSQKNANGGSTTERYGRGRLTTERYRRDRPTTDRYRRDPPNYGTATNYGTYGKSQSDALENESEAALDADHPTRATSYSHTVTNSDYLLRDNVWLVFGRKYVVARYLSGVPLSQAASSTQEITDIEDEADCWMSTRAEEIFMTAVLGSRMKRSATKNKIFLTWQLWEKEGASGKDPGSYPERCSSDKHEGLAGDPVRTKVGLSAQNWFGRKWGVRAFSGSNLSRHKPGSCRERTKVYDRSSGVGHVATMIYLPARSPSRIRLGQIFAHVEWLIKKVENKIDFTDRSLSISQMFVSAEIVGRK
ncbi:hypothetical protein C8R45DRAFT_1073652 [Mycena sanguinolenta]|nr:hypothetical protein C8R45DRAFT_1073652 [Mycena sanguinolenta]